MKLALPINHPALPRDAGQLKAMGCAYANCAPTPEVRMMKSLQAQAAEMHYSGCIPASRIAAPHIWY